MEAEGFSGPDLKKHWWSHVAQLWRGLSEHQRCLYSAKAAADFATRNQERLKHLQSLRNLVALEQDRQAADEQQETGLPLHVSSFKFADADLAHMADIYERLSPADMRHWHDVAKESP